MRPAALLGVVLLVVALLLAPGARTDAEHPDLVPALLKTPR
jgi:hypothetical protein